MLRTGLLGPASKGAVLPYFLNKAANPAPVQKLADTPALHRRPFCAVHVWKSALQLRKVSNK